MKPALHELSPISKKPPNPVPIPVDVNADCQSIVVNAPAAEVYGRLLRFEALPRFIASIKKLDRISDTRFSCTSIINGKEVKSDVMIMMRVPDRRIAWQAASDDFRVGAIFIDPLLGGATKVTVKVRSIVESVRLTAALDLYLRNLKQFIEAEIVVK